MSWLITLPLVIPFATAILALLAGNNRSLRRGVTLVGSVALTWAAWQIFQTVRLEGVLAAQMGRWAAPFGITMVADPVSAIMVLLTAIIGLGGVLYSFADIDARRESFGYYSLLHLLLGAVCGAFLAGDLFNLYVWYELVLISSFSLLILGGEKAQIDGAIKYLALNLVATLMLLSHQYPNQMSHLTLALFIAWGMSMAILLLSNLFLRLLGDKGVSALERLMGLILVMLSTQMFLDGIRAYLKI